MAEATYTCPACKTAFAVEPGTQDLDGNCPNCSAHLQVYFFPPFFRPTPKDAAATALVDASEASCFYHAQKQAVRVCDGCGRMICSLCSIELGQQHLCPNCLSSGKKKGKLTTLESNRMRHDSLALTLAFLGLLIYVLGIFLAPAAIYVAIRHWNSPGSLVGGNSKVRFTIAIILAVAVICLWLLFFGFLLFHPGKK